MTSNLEIDSGWTEAYERTFYKMIHNWLYMGYQSARERITCETQEEDITGEIFAAMKIMKKNGCLHPDYVRYSVENEAPDYTGNRRGKNRKIIDIRINHSTTTSETEFVFEAKRLRKRGYPISKYVGKSGLGCFLHNEYARDHHAAGMIAYIQSDEPSCWSLKLSTKLNKDTKKEYKLLSNLTSINIIPEISNEWLTVHKREENSDIKIYHIFFDCL